MYEFSLSSFLWGIAILTAGTLAVVFHQKIADNLMSGVSSYDKVKLYGVIACGIGFLVMTNLHVLILRYLLKLFF